MVTWNIIVKQIGRANSVCSSRCCRSLLFEKLDSRADFSEWRSSRQDHVREGREGTRTTLQRGPLGIVHSSLRRERAAREGKYYVI